MFFLKKTNTVKKNQLTNKAINSLQVSIPIYLFKKLKEDQEMKIMCNDELCIKNVCLNRHYNTLEKYGETF